MAASRTQEELAAATGLSPHTISDLERQVSRAPHASTVQLLADALSLTGAQRAHFEAEARRHGDEAMAAAAHLGEGPALAAARGRGDPRAWLAFIVTRLDELGPAEARSAVRQWRASGPADETWPDWAERLVELAAAGKLPPLARRPLPATATGLLLGRERQTAELTAFLDRVREGRGGLALVLGPAGIGKSQLLVHLLAGQRGGIDVEWMTFERGEGGYQGWRRLLAPLWTTVRRADLAPASLLAHAATLDEVLLLGNDADLAGRQLPGEVATAIAALLAHASARGPLVLVVDDAHRGGPSSDHLLIDLARLVNARGVGLVAAIRPDELDADSPLRGYDAKDGGRAAADVVTSVDVPPFGPEATALLLKEVTGSSPPDSIVEQVLRQTGGLPQLIINTDVRAPQSPPADSWTVGELGTAGLKLLDSVISNRPQAARDVLQAAAIYAGSLSIEPDVIGRLTDLSAEEVEGILDDERRRGVILAPAGHGYRFSHDNWIDALVGSCQAVRRREIHARSLALLHAGRSADPRQLARHALGAGAAMVGDKEIVACARDAADLAIADYAFGTAADLYQQAARHAADAERIDLLIMQADACRFGGQWDKARAALKDAAALARTLGLSGLEAIALVHLERLTWSYGLREIDLTQQIRDMLGRLPRAETTLRAQAQAALGARLSITTRHYESEPADLAETVLRDLPLAADASSSLARADIMLGVRSALQDFRPPDVLLGYDQEVLDLGLELRSAHHISEALSNRIIDLIRAGRVRELPAAVRAFRKFADQSAARVILYGQALVDAMLALARGDFGAARDLTDTAAGLCAEFGDSMAGEALMAQAGWLLYETGQVDGLTELLAALPTRDVSSLNELVWELGAGLIHAERHEAEPAIRILTDVFAATGDLAQVPRGPSRIGILATGAMLLGHPFLIDLLAREDAGRWGRGVAGLLANHPDSFVLAGWPAVLLGSKHRYIGLCLLAAGRPEEAAAHLSRAAVENVEFPALQVRTLFDQARAMLRQTVGRDGALELLDRAARRAAELGMAGLAAQAAAERSRT